MSTMHIQVLGPSRTWGPEPVRHICLEEPCVTNGVILVDAEKVQQHAQFHQADHIEINPIPISRYAYAGNEFTGPNPE